MVCQCQFRVSVSAPGIFRLLRQSRPRTPSAHRLPRASGQPGLRPPSFRFLLPVGFLQAAHPERRDRLGHGHQLRRCLRSSHIGPPLPPQFQLRADLSHRAPYVKTPRRHHPPPPPPPPPHPATPHLPHPH